MENNKKKYYIIAAVFLVALLVVSGSYAYWTTRQTQSDENVVGTTCLSLSLTDTEASKTGVKLQKTYPISDEEGMSLEGYQFTLTNRCSGYVAYTVNLESLINNNRIALSSINAVLDSNPVQLLSAYETGTQVLDSNVADDARALTDGVLAPAGSEGYTKTYRLRLWVDKYAPATQMSKSYSGKITISAYNTTEPVQAVNAAQYITNLAATDDNILSDGTVDNNLRFVGATPNNYVSFNNELWQIIGVMNNVDGGTTSGDDATRIKIMRSEPLAEQMKWNDTSASGVSNNLLNNENTVVRLGELDTTGSKSVQTATYAANNWEHSTLNNYLNTTYYNSLSNKNLIDTATWYLGDARWYELTASQAYTAERSSTVYNDNPTSITSNIGLMYPSDYGYSIGNSSVAVATGTGTSTSTAESSSSRTACLAYKLSGYGSRICKYNSWILGSTTNTDYYEWFLSPDSYDGYDSDSAAGLYGYGLVYTSNVDLAYAVRPVLYLKSTTKIVGGQGTSSNPYQLSA
ncbi:MAG: hypothetical protein IJ574_04515 [Bacilli bacterium]|nr:hypothetical protein [Bacilli bacterium]